MPDRSEPLQAAPQAPPFFVMGCEASGTNLVSLILDSHPRLAVCRGTHYYLLFAAERRYYGDLHARAGQRRLARDFLEMVRAYRLDAPPLEDVLEALREPTFEGVLEAFLRVYARRQGKARGGERSSLHYRYLSEIQAGFPGSPVVFTMRDPRDVALAHRSGFGYSAESAAASWNGALRCLQRATRPVHLVRYEELVRTPQQTLEALCATLGEPFAPAMLTFHERTPETYRDQPHHRRLFRPLDASSVGAFQQLPAEEIARVEALCADGMKEMGYAPLYPASAAPQPGKRTGRGEGVDLLRRVGNRFRYYRWDRDRWRRGLLHWKIVLRARLAFLLR